MRSLSASSQLRLSIISIELKHSVNEQLLIEQFKVTYESIQPANILRKVIGNIIPAPSVANSITSSILGIILGYFTKKITISSSKNKFRELLGTILQVSITNIVTGNPNTLKTVINYITNHVFVKKEHNSSQT